MPERLLWARLRRRGLAGLKWRRQHVMGPFIVDFFCHAARLVVELDGRTHIDRESEDDLRTRYLRRRGVTVIRFTNDEVIRDADAVALAVLAAARKDA